MLKRIWNKGIWFLDLALGKIFLSLEKKKILQPIQFTFYKRLENGSRVDHKFPLNIVEKDKYLFAHYTGYRTNDEQIYLLRDINVTRTGLVFKGLKNFGPSLPHPVFRNSFGPRYLLEQYLFSKKIVTPKNKRYVLIHDFWSYNNYYHWIVDTLPRLKLMLEELHGDNYALVLHAPRAKFVDAILKYFDVKHIVTINEKEYLSVSELLVPYYMAGSGHIHPQMVFEIRQFFLGKITSSEKGERIYVSRGRQKARRIINEAHVVDVLANYGFEVVYWEDRTFEEQVQTARNAKYMITSHGANLANCMFMPEGAKVLEIIKEHQPNFCYWELASVARLDYYYQLAQMPKKDHLFVDIDMLKKNVERMLND